MAVVCSGNALRAADFVLSSSPASNAVTATLEYLETDYSVVNLGVSLTTQTTPFKREPVAAAGKVVRGVLNFGGDPGNAISFIWQRDARKLFLDLNRNQDLTDDAAGTFSSRMAMPVNYQTFTSVRLPLATAQGRCQMLVDVNFYDYGARPNCNLSLRCFWQGRVTLHGRDWQAGIIQNMATKAGSLEGGQLLLRPWEKRNKAFSAFGTAPDVFPVTRKLFVDGHAYQLDLVSNSQNDQSKPALQFTEQSVALGELSITGKNIQRLVLSGGPYLVLLEQPAGVVKVPTGSYSQARLRLEQNGTEAVYSSSQAQSGRRISVKDATLTILNLGGPLTNSIIASRHGEDLRLDYRLVGAGGETYELVNQNRSQPPEFAIYKDANKIASGKFEFG